jgi:hypothetical protein
VNLESPQASTQGLFQQLRLLSPTITRFCLTSTLCLDYFRVE